MRVTYSMAALDDDANGVCVDQTTGGAADLTLDGALVSDGVATMAEAQKMSLESAGNISGVTFTITGTNADGIVFSEEVTGPNATTVHSSEYFKTVTGIAVSGAVGTNTEIGPLKAQGGVSPTIVCNTRGRNLEAGLFCYMSSGANFTYSVQHSSKDPQTNILDANWFNNSGITTSTTSTDGNYDKIPTCCRVKYTTHTSGTLDFEYIQP